MEFQNQNFQFKNANDKTFSVNTFKEYEKKVNVNAIKIIAVCISLIGIIVGVIWGNTEKVYDHYDEYFNVGLMFLTWLISDIVAVFLYTAALILEQLLKTNATLKVWNQTGLISNDALSTASEYFDDSMAWKCQRCGKINSNYVGTCGCGQRKDENQLLS